MLGDVQLVAGATVRLKGFQSFDRKYKITKATHKLTGGYTTDIEEGIDFCKDVTIGEDYSMIVQLAQKAQRVRLPRGTPCLQ